MQGKEVQTLHQTNLKIMPELPVSKLSFDLNDFSTVNRHQLGFHIYLI